MPERIAPIKPTEDGRDGQLLFFHARNETEPLTVQQRSGQEPSATIRQELARYTFAVYTTGEIDAALEQRGAAAAAALNEAERRTDTKLRELDATLRAEVVQSINSLPQRVLAQEVGQALKEAVLQELRDELVQLRAELKAEIDAVRSERFDR